MAQLVCENVSKGMRDEERTVSVRDAASAQRSFIRVEADFLTLHGGKHYLPVGVVQEESQGLVLVELPQEPDAGNRRLWVRPADLWRGERVSA